jgi:hypothetical protein
MKKLLSNTGSVLLGVGTVAFYLWVLFELTK